MNMITKIQPCTDRIYVPLKFSGKMHKMKILFSVHVYSLSHKDPSPVQVNPIPCKYSPPVAINIEDINFNRLVELFISKNKPKNPFMLDRKTLTRITCNDELYAFINSKTMNKHFFETCDGEMITPKMDFDFFFGGPPLELGTDDELPPLELDTDDELPPLELDTDDELPPLELDTDDDIPTSEFDIDDSSTRMVVFHQTKYLFEKLNCIKAEILRSASTISSLDVSIKDACETSDDIEYIKTLIESAAHEVKLQTTVAIDLISELQRSKIVRYNDNKKNYCATEDIKTTQSVTSDQLLKDRKMIIKLEICELSDSGSKFTMNAPNIEQMIFESSDLTLDHIKDKVTCTLDKIGYPKRHICKIYMSSSNVYPELFFSIHNSGHFIEGVNDIKASLQEQPEDICVRFVVKKDFAALVNTVNLKGIFKSVEEENLGKTTLEKIKICNNMLSNEYFPIKYMIDARLKSKNETLRFEKNKKETVIDNNLPKMCNGGDNFSKWSFESMHSKCVENGACMLCLLILLENSTSLMRMQYTKPHLREIFKSFFRQKFDNEEIKFTERLFLNLLDYGVDNKVLKIEKRARTTFYSFME